jgi:hypothetical protein
VLGEGASKVNVIPLLLFYQYANIMEQLRGPHEKKIKKEHVRANHSLLDGEPHVKKRVFLFERVFQLSAMYTWRGYLAGTIKVDLPSLSIIL